MNYRFGWNQMIKVVKHFQIGRCDLYWMWLSCWKHSGWRKVLQVVADFCNVQNHIANLLPYNFKTIYCNKFPTKKQLLNFYLICESCIGFSIMYFLFYRCWLALVHKTVDCSRAHCMYIGLGTSRRRTTNHSGVVAVTPSRPWSIPIIAWPNNVISHVFMTKYVQNHHQTERCRLLASIVKSRISP